MGIEIKVVTYLYIVWNLKSFHWYPFFFPLLVLVKSASWVPKMVFKKINNKLGRNEDILGGLFQQTAAHLRLLMFKFNIVWYQFLSISLQKQHHKFHHLPNTFSWYVHTLTMIVKQYTKWIENKTQKSPRLLVIVTLKSY